MNALTRAGRLRKLIELRDRIDAEIAELYRPPKRTRSQPVCGTDGGYQRHLRLGETTCPECRVAHADLIRARRIEQRRMTREDTT